MGMVRFDVFIHFSGYNNAINNIFVSLDQFHRIIKTNFKIFQFYIILYWNYYKN